MKQVLQDLRSGKVYLEEVPIPSAGRSSILIASSVSLVSPGTERMLVEFGKGNLFQKAKAQPEKVKQVLDSIKTNGLLPTLETVFSRLNEPLPLGYCNVGRVIEVGCDVRGFAVGDRVISNGPHAEYVLTTPNLCAKLPDNVSDEQAAFTVLGSIALQGIRLANPTLGETVYVMGLGLLGLLTVQMLRANGCRVLGADFDPARLEMARRFGCQTTDLSAGGDPIGDGLARTGGKGVDAVIVTAATQSDELMHQAAEMSRKRGRIILVGVAGLNLRRSDFYKKELTFQVSCSYGPGRYDSGYEDKGLDYPIGFVRWTEQRNFEAILGMMESGALDTTPFITHRFPISQAPAAYDVLTGDKSALGLIFSYESSPAPKKGPVEISPRTSASAVSGVPRIGVIGAGNFARMKLLPAFKKAACSVEAISSQKGATASAAARRFGIPLSAADNRDLICSPNIDAVAITTRHNSHSALVCQALAAGKHVFVEKPLAIDMEGLREVRRALTESGPMLMVGFNRRFSPHIVRMQKLMEARSEPLCLTYLVNAGATASDSWTQDPAVGGGRIVGEGCHFIDTLRFLVGYPIISVFAVQMDHAGNGIGEDKMSIQLKFADGSVGQVNYWANGSKSFMKEQLTAFSDGRILVLENFQRTTGWGYKGFSKFKTSRQDKGHSAEVAAFCNQLGKGGNLIPVEELFEVTLATFAAVASAREGSLQTLEAWMAKLLADSGED